MSFVDDYKSLPKWAQIAIPVGAGALFLYIWQPWKKQETSDNNIPLTQYMPIAASTPTVDTSTQSTLPIVQLPNGGVAIPVDYTYYPPNNGNETAIEVPPEQEHDTQQTPAPTTPAPTTPAPTTPAPTTPAPTTPKPATPAPTTPKPTTPAGQYITFKKGDTIWGITRKLHPTWSNAQIAAYANKVIAVNKIKDARKIYVGTKVFFPNP